MHNLAYWAARERDALVDLTGIPDLEVVHNVDTDRVFEFGERFRINFEFDGKPYRYEGKLSEYDYDALVDKILERCCA